MIFTRLFMSYIAMQYDSWNRDLRQIAAVIGDEFYIGGGADFSPGTALNHRSHGQQPGDVCVKRKAAIPALRQ